jgi:hypothetical protein
MAELEAILQSDLQEFIRAWVMSCKLKLSL